MQIKTIYKVISGASSEIEHVLNLLAKDDWRPVAMSCHGRPSILTVILENKLMDEAKLDIASTLAHTTDPTPEEEIQ